MGFDGSRFLVYSIHRSRPIRFVFWYVGGYTLIHTLLALEPRWAFRLERL